MKSKTVVAIAIIGLTAACAPKKPDAEVVYVPAPVNKPEDPKTGPEPQKCDDMSYSEGKTADLELLKNTREETTNFGKHFHGNILDAIANASAAETILALKTLNLPIFKGPEKKKFISKNCMFESLPEATGSAAKNWKEANAGLAAGQTILGLYMGREKLQSTASLFKILQ